MKWFLFFLAGGLVFFEKPARCESEEGGAARLRFTERDLPSNEKDPAGLSEIDEAAARRGFHYARDTRRAAGGDPKALQKFFELAEAADGAAAESNYRMPTVVYHLLGDEKFAQFLERQPLAFQVQVRNRIISDGLPAPATAYLRRHFPKTSALLFRREMVGWFSPNDRYAIRKVFSDLELGGSKVERAELIEKASGRVLCDLTADDIGTGAMREGEALWSPDSTRVACLSSDLTVSEGSFFTNPPPAPMRKQTTVYQLAGDSFRRVELSLGKAPDAGNDPELKGAVPGHIFTEPVRWRRANVLLLNRHEYYRKLVPTTVEKITFESVQDLGRSYAITITFDPDGKAATSWKREED